jgi:integrase
MVRRTAEQLAAAGQTPRTRGEGSVFQVQTKHGMRWRATRSVTDEHGRPRQVSGTATDRQTAVERCNDSYLRWLVKMGQAAPSVIRKAPVMTSMTTAEFLDVWWQWKIQDDEGRTGLISANVGHRYKTLIQRHIVPHIGHIPVRSLNEDHIRTLLRTTLPGKTRLVKGRSEPEPLLGPTPIRTVQNVLQMMCDYGVKKRILLENPMDNVPRVKKAEQKDEGLENLRWLSSYLKHHLEGTDEEAQWIFAFWGLRQSERLGLTWSAFTYLNDPKRTTQLKIHRQLYRNEATKQFSLEKTKTKASNRVVAVDERVAAVMRQHKLRQAEWKKSPDWNPLPGEGMDDLCFTTKTGLPIRQTTENKQWHAMLKRHGYKPIRQHALRHFAVSLLVSEHVPLEIVSKYIGHSSVEITRSIYTHLNIPDQEIIIDKLGERVFERSDQAKRAAAAREQKEKELTLKLSQ